MKKKSKTAKKTTKKFVVITSKMYGNKFRGTKIHWEGKRPAKLKDDGQFGFGKAVLERLDGTFTKYKWILTENINEITVKYGITNVRTSTKSMSEMTSQSFAKGKAIKEEIILSKFSGIYPGHFKYESSIKYNSGDLAKILKEDIVKDLSPEDQTILNEFIPKYIARSSAGSINLIKAEAQISTLKQIGKEMRDQIQKKKLESYWQSYIQKNILIIQQGYIKSIEKLNVKLGGTGYPDFMLVTHDNFLDVLEIKTPQASLLSFDSSHDNYYWSAEAAKTISQVENYLERIQRSADAIRSFIKDNLNIELQVIRPRGIILAGDNSNFTLAKQRDDFRLLTQATKNIIFLTYDELVRRLENYITVLEEFTTDGKQ